MFLRVLLSACALGLADRVPQTSKCGYESCRDAKRGVLNVHIVAHTHDDVGWLKTVDEYYISHVRKILDSVTRELCGYPHRRFIIVETAFFWKWWVEQSQETRMKVHDMVTTGQLMFAGGAWSMNDEAAAHYQSIIDQFTWGLKKLIGTFGECGIPRVGWQIDPFGHSREFASLLAAMGYDGVFMSRIDYQDKEKRKANLSMEMLWRGDDDLGNSSDIFASVFYGSYVMSPPQKKIADFIKYVIKVSKCYATNNVLIPIGHDFAFTDASRSFRILDKAIELTNQIAVQKGLPLRAFYSTPTCYLKAVKDRDPALPTKQDDFFPYASGPSDYWTGYYTSRPTTKYLERLANSYLQVAKQLQVLAGLKDKKTILAINKLRTAMGVVQHHDAITGTEKQHVADDYVNMLDRAIKMALLVPQKAINKIMFGNEDAQILFFKRCHFNESRCKTSETSRQFIVAVYNPLAWHVSEPIRIPVVEGNYDVYAPDGLEGGKRYRRLYEKAQLHSPLKGNKIVFQVVEIPPEVLSIPRQNSEATHEIVFIANLKPLMLITYYVHKKNKNDSDVANPKKLSIAIDRLPGLIENKHIRLSTNYTSQITHATLTDGTETKLNIQFCYYTSSGGAYTFRPMENKPHCLGTKISPGTTGSVVQEIRITSDNASSVVRIYDGFRYIENEWVIGPINVEDGVSKEYIVKYSTDVVNNAQFYTDSNGRQIIKRILNKRPQWNLEVKDPVAEYYYPVTNKIFIEDNKKKVIILTDRAEGGTSLEEGQIELMLHRRLLDDDGFGLNEALNEVANGTGLIVRGRHRILITKHSLKHNIEERKNVFQMHLKPQVLIANANNLETLKGPQPFKKWMSLKKTETFANELPEGVHLLTLEPWKKSKLLLRLENFFEKSDDSCTTVHVDLEKIFKYIEVLTFAETNLAGHQSINEKNKWTWKTRDQFVKHFNEAYGNNETEELAKNVTMTELLKNDYGMIVKLTAKQIRTFVVSYKIKLLLFI